MTCDDCILEKPSSIDPSREQLWDELNACSDCPEVASGPPALRVTLERLRQCAHQLRKTQTKLRQREEDLAAALKATAEYEERIENIERVYKQSARELEPQLVVVERQAETIRALSAPILEVGEGVVAMPIIGTLDEARGQLITNALLARVHERATRLVILDLTGLEQAENATTLALLRACGALRMLGAKVVMCGLRSSIAKELVRLETDLSAIRTFPTLRSALERFR